ncbi:MAG: hypothetical protein KF904_21750 [Rhodoblastus sp.]|nr:hypothetical protein [Rhodoblastus sp.]
MARARGPIVLPWALGALFLAGIVHISSVLLMPRFAENDAYVRLGGATQQGLKTLPDASIAQSMPFQDQRAEYAVCHFDLDRGATRVRSNVTPDALVAISFHDRSGRIFYSTTDRAALRGRIDVRLLTPRQLDSVEASDPEDQTPQELRLTPPTNTGFVLVRALIEQPGGREAAHLAANAVQCLMERE